jgi:predicted Rdx family selenoprotein
MTNSNKNPAIYVLTDCGNPVGTCLAGSVTMVVPDGTAELELTPPTTATYTIGVDTCSAWDLTRDGPFVLEIKLVP